MGLNIRTRGRLMASAVAKTLIESACRLPGLDNEYHIKERLSGPWPQGPCLWLHGASLGECRMLLGLAQILKEDLPNCPALLVTTQKAEVVSFLRESFAGVADIAIAPADIPSVVEAFLSTTRPLSLILGENELWPGYLSTLSRISTKKNIALVSGRYRRSFPFLDFSGMALACMQTSCDLGRFSRISKGNVPCVVGGDWKLLSWAREGGKVQVPVNPTIDVAFLSFHQEESDAFLQMAKDCVESGMSVVLVPRRLSETGIFRNCLNDAALPIVEYPTVKPGAVSIVSRFGAVREILGMSKAAVVGGSFSRKLGIHDFWEPLQMGVATYVGPYSRGHEDTVALLCEEKAVSRIRCAQEFLNCVQPLPERAQAFLAIEKKKILDSYSMLLKFLKELV